VEPDTRKLAGLEQRQGTVVIRLDDGEVLEVAPDAVPSDMPQVGGSLGFPLLASLREAAARKKAAQRLFVLLDRKLMTRTRLRGKLLDAGHAEHAVDAVLDQGEAAGLFSDRAFAEAFCRDTLRGKAVGGFWLVSKLREKGVGADLAREVVRDSLTPEMEHDLALQAARRRWRRESAGDQRALARVQRFLASRGFAASICRAAAEATRPDAPCNSGPEDRS